MCVRERKCEKKLCVKVCKSQFFSLLLHFIPSYYPKTNKKKETSIIFPPPLFLPLQHYDTSLLLFVLSASLSRSSLRGLDTMGGCRVSDLGLGG